MNPRKIHKIWIIRSRLEACFQESIVENFSWNFVWIDLIKSYGCFFEEFLPSTTSRIFSKCFLSNAQVSSVARIFFGGTPRSPFKGYQAPRRDSGGGSPRTVAKFKILTRFKVLKNESIFKIFNIFFPEKSIFYKKNFQKLNIFSKNFLFFPENYFKSSIFQFLWSDYKSKEVSDEFYYLVEKFIKKSRYLIKIWRIISIGQGSLSNLLAKLCVFGPKMKKILKKSLRFFDQNLYGKLTFFLFLLSISWISASSPKVYTTCR